MEEEIDTLNLTSKEKKSILNSRNNKKRDLINFSETTDESSDKSYESSDKSMTDPSDNSDDDDQGESNLPGEILVDIDTEDNIDNASVLVIILQCETKPCDANINNLKWVFSDPYFTVQVCEVTPPVNVPSTVNMSQNQYLENYFMRKALTYAAEGPYLEKEGTFQPQYYWTKLPCIIVKDSSISNVTPEGTIAVDNRNTNKFIGGMKRRIMVALNKAQEADLFYLTKWDDLCNKQKAVENVGNIDHGSTIKWSLQPTATQAIMYTPSSRDYIREALIAATIPLSTLLNMFIANGQLLAVVFVPNIIDYDISLATSNSDFNKLNECSPVANANGSSSQATSLAWFIVIVAIIILVATCLILLGPRYGPVVQ